MKKALISLLLAALMLLGTVACNTPKNPEESGTVSAVPVSTERNTQPAGTQETPSSAEDLTDAPDETTVPDETEGVNAFAGEHVLYLSNGAYGRYFSFTVSSDSETLREIHTIYTITEYDGSNKIETWENEKRHADITYTVTGNRIEIRFFNYHNPESYWLGSLIKAGLDDLPADFDYEDETTVIVSFEK